MSEKRELSAEFRLFKREAARERGSPSPSKKGVTSSKLPPEHPPKKTNQGMIDAIRREARDVLTPIDSNPCLNSNPFVDDSSSKIGEVLKPLTMRTPLSPSKARSTAVGSIKSGQTTAAKIDDSSNFTTPTVETTNVDEIGREALPSLPHISDITTGEFSLPSDENDVPMEILEEMSRIQESFNLDHKYRLIDKIGEGTFSSVYKAEDLTGRAKLVSGHSVWSSPLKEPEIKRRKKNNSNTPKVYVALKRIYVTSSPQRISNELRLLFNLATSSRVAPLLEALRHEDQVIAVLPYYPHSDFRDFFRDLPLDGIRIYMYELFHALNFVHHKNIIHRDIKPTNFLYDPFKKKGVLVDFGLAEIEDFKTIDDPTHHNFCPCSSKAEYRIEEQVKGYPRNDDRFGRRANRAGTRGFRAPEVLFKCPYQTTKIDNWSAGVILLTLLSRRFPFFNSRDDTDALVELTTIFGLREMQDCAAIHGLGIDTSLPTLGRACSLEEIIHRCLYEEKKKDTLPSDGVAIDMLNAFDHDHNIVIDSTVDSLDVAREKQGYKDAFDVMRKCFVMDPKKRGSAAEILKMPFFSSMESSEVDRFDDDIVLQGTF